MEWTIRRGLTRILGGLALVVVACSFSTAEVSLLLKPGVPISARVEVDDVAHFLGERFTVTVVVQYRSEFVELRTESIQQASFAPFETTGHFEVNSSDLTDSVKEYRHVAELRAISALPGYVYQPPSIPLEYVDHESGDQRILEIPFSQPLYVSTYYGNHADKVPLRPLRGELEMWSRQSKFLAGGSVLLFALSLGFVTSWGLEAREATRRSRSVADGDSHLFKLQQSLTDLADRTVHSDLDSRMRLKEVEVLAIKFCQEFLDCKPRDFWQYSNTRLGALVGILERRYAGNELEHVDVERAVQIFRQLLPVSKDRHS